MYQFISSFSLSLDLQVILKYSIIGRSWGILYLLTMNSYQSSLIRRQWPMASAIHKAGTKLTLPHVKTQQQY